MHRILALLALTFALAAALGAVTHPAPSQTELARELPGSGDDDAET